MDGGNAVEEGRGSAGFDLPAVLARLDGCATAERRAALETIVDHVDDDPDACLATVPKLRRLLGEPDFEHREAVADCLATLAAHSPVDVAPSADEIAAFVGSNPNHDATPALIRCLEAVSTDRPNALADHVEALAAALESEDTDVRATAAGVLERLAAETDATVEPARDRLDALAADDPDPDTRERAKSALERLS